MDPNKAMNILATEFNKFINFLAPEKRITIKKDEEPYTTNEMREAKTISENMLNNAIQNNCPDNWRLFKYCRNKYFNLRDKIKTEYYKNILNKDFSMWRTLKMKERGDPPSEILWEGKRVTSPKKISNIINKFYKQKIKKIESAFKDPKVDPIEILERVCNKPKSKFSFRKMKYEETLEIINSMKNTNSCGFDGISSKTIKKVPKQTAMYMTHIINCIIERKIYPEILKISKITPILKSDKDKLNPGSYRPISNLTTYDKIIQEWLRIQISEYLEDNLIISPAHHGSRPGYNTLTAKNTIDYLLAKGVEDNNTTILLNTDLSAAYDVVNHSIMLKKMEFYGFDENSRKVIESMLTDRIQFTEVEGYKSDPQTMPNTSVLQGSKLSGIFFIIYVNEFPELQKLLEDEEFLQEKKYSNLKKMFIMNQ